MFYTIRDLNSANPERRAEMLRANDFQFEKSARVLKAEIDAVVIRVHENRVSVREQRAADLRALNSVFRSIGRLVKR